MARTAIIRSISQGARGAYGFIGLGVPIVLLAAWELSASHGLLPRYLIAPSEILSTLWTMISSGELFGHAGSSVFRAAMGFLIGASCGAALGLLAGVAPPVERFYEPIISLTYPVPKIAVLPIIFAWLGLGDASKIAVITASVFFPVYISAFYGAKSASRLHIWSAQNMGASRLQIFRRIIVPSALPQLFGGLRVAVALSFVVMFTAELVASTNGLGFLIGRAEDSLRFDIMYVAILSIGLIGFCADRLLLAVRARLLVGQLLGKDQGQ